MWIRVVGVCAVALLALSARTAAAAPASISLGIGQPTLASDRATIELPLTISCSLSDPSFTLYVTRISVSVEQGHHKIAVASVNAYGDNLVGRLFLCDGSTQAVTV